MTLSQVCDLAYALLREEVTDQVRSARLVWGMNGDGKSPAPSLEDELAKLDKALEHDATAGLTTEELELREVLGVGLK